MILLNIVKYGGFVINPKEGENCTVFRVHIPVMKQYTYMDLSMTACLDFTVIDREMKEEAKCLPCNAAITLSKTHNADNYAHIMRIVLFLIARYMCVMSSARLQFIHSLIDRAVRVFFQVDFIATELRGLWRIKHYTSWFVSKSEQIFQKVTFYGCFQ